MTLPRRVFVTGATGYIGRRLVMRLITEPVDVFGVVRRRSGTLPEIESGDLAEFDGWHRLLRPGDHVVHAAGVAHGLIRMRQRQTFEDNPIEGVRRLIAGAERTGGVSITFLSSAAVYGVLPPGSVVDERAQLLGDSPYARGKQHVEAMISEFATRGAVGYSLRIPMVYGPDAPGNFRRMVKAVRLNLPIPIPEADLERSCRYIENLCDAVATLLRSSAPAAAYNVADTERTTVAALIEMLGAAMGRETRRAPRQAVRFAMRLPLIGGILRPLSQALSLDISAFQSATAWVPPHSQSRGVLESV